MLGYPSFCPIRISFTMSGQVQACPSQNAHTSAMLNADTKSQSLSNCNPNAAQILTPCADRSAHILHARGLLGIQKHSVPSLAFHSVVVVARTICAYTCSGKLLPHRRSFRPMHIRIQRSDETSPVALHERHDPMIRLAGMITRRSTATNILGAPDRAELDCMRHSQSTLHLRWIFHVVSVIPVAVDPIPREGAGNKQVRTHVPHIAVSIRDLTPPGTRVGEIRTMIGEESLDSFEML